MPKAKDTYQEKPWYKRSNSWAWIVTGACFLDSNTFEDAIRKAVSLGGNSDTLASITGGIAEAYYKEIPKMIADRVYQLFPTIFHKILDAFRKKTV